MGEYWIVWAVLDVKRGVRFEFIWQDREYRDCYQGLGLGDDYQSFVMEALGAATRGTRWTRLMA